MMRRALVFGISLFIMIIFSAGISMANTREDLKNDFGIELLGKAVLYNFSYQYMVNSRIGLEAGIAGLGGTDATIVMVPLGAKFYIAPKDASPFITGGIVALTGKIDQGSIEANSYTYLGLGFEFRSGSGFLFRGTAYGLIADGSFVIWPGLYIGYAF